MKQLKALLLFGLFTLPIATQAQRAKGPSAGANFDLRKKAEAKEGKRWTLSEWLEQKNKNYLMDLWLGMYGPSPYEFYISGCSISSESTTTYTPTSAGTDLKNSYRSYSGSIGAYAMIMGLVADYENNTELGRNDLSGSLNLRVLGNAVQGTHLIIQYGLRTRHIDNSINQVRLNNQFAGADLDLYLMRYFGLHGAYRSFLPYNEPILGETKGAKTEAGLFIDFGPVRIFGNWYSDDESSTLNGPTSTTTSKTIDTGIASGVKLFF
jgi:hypothetical protein